MIHIEVSPEAMRAFCQRWGVAKLWLFGSVLRDDFHAASDVDVLLQYEPASRRTLFDLVDMRDELESIFGRRVDMTNISCLKNPYRCRSIMRSREKIYAVE